MRPATHRVRFAAILAVLAACGPRDPGPVAHPALGSESAASLGARFNAAGELLPPRDYRDWVYLTSGYAMSYGPAAQAAQAAGIEMFDTVFVDRAAHAEFLKTGVWPEGTTFVLELRQAEDQGSIVSRGHFQTELTGIEVAHKDSRRFPGGWGYFDVPTDSEGPRAPAAPLPADASCYPCHAQHGGVENTFTQFYPTLFAAAKRHGTVRPDFVGIPPTPAEFVAEVARAGWSAGERRLAEVERRWPGANLLREASLNRIGYELLGEGDKVAAVAAFAEAARRFPASVNAWDSLSEAQEAAGDVRGARVAVESGLRAAAAAGDSLPPSRLEALTGSLRARKARLAAAP